MLCLFVCVDSKEKEHHRAIQIEYETKHQSLSLTNDWRCRIPEHTQQLLENIISQMVSCDQMNPMRDITHVSIRGLPKSNEVPLLDSSYRTMSIGRTHRPAAVVVTGGTGGHDETGGFYGGLENEVKGKHPAIHTLRTGMCDVASKMGLGGEVTFRAMCLLQRYVCVNVCVYVCVCLCVCV